MFTTSLIDIPWDDVVFNNIFPRLKMVDVLRLRSVSNKYKKMVNSYINNLKCLRIEAVLSPADIMTLANHTRSLEKLNASNSKATNEFIITVLRNNNKCLTHINLSYTNLSDRSLHGLINCRNLRQLLLKDCYWFTNECLESLIFHLDSLEYLNAKGCIQLQLQLLVPQLCSMPRLKFYNVSTGSWDETIGPPRYVDQAEKIKCDKEGWYLNAG